MLWVAVVSLSLASSCKLTAASEAANNNCERLPATLTYTQEEAPRDLSSVVSKDALALRSFCIALYCIDRTFSDACGQIKTTLTVFFLLFYAKQQHRQRLCETWWYRLQIHSTALYFVLYSIVAPGSGGKNQPRPKWCRGRRSGMDGCRITRPCRWALDRNTSHPIDR